MPPLRRFVRACLALPLFILGCSVPLAPQPTDEKTVVYVIERGWHTDIGFPVNEIDAPLAALANSFPGSRFLTFGFGERQYVVDRRQTFLGMLNALLPSQSVLLMTALRTTPEDAFGQNNVVVLGISRMALARIEAAIWQDLERTTKGEPVLLADGPYSGSAFYAATGTYSGLYTCNTWTAQMLRSGDFPMPVTGILFSGQVMGMARWMGTHHAPTSSH